MKHILHPYARFCTKLRREKLLRTFPQEGNFQHDFSTNDYLGFSQHPLLVQAAIDIAEIHGVGSKASRIITTKQTALCTLEHHIACAKNTAAAIIYATGYQANLSVIGALLDKQILGKTPLIFSDKLNHASINTACQLSKAKLYRYRHLDYDHLAYFLKYTSSIDQPKFIISESVFGMDGDVADLAMLIKLAKQYHALLYIDEAHATGIFGSKGYGFSGDFGSEVDITMGTFSKALGGSGAYIACSNTLKRYLLNRSSGLIFSTAPSPMQVAAMQKAWDLIPEYQFAARTLLQTANQLRTKLQHLNYDTGHSTTHIIPLLLGSPERTLAAQRFLGRRGIRISAIRPPSVPKGQSRLRIALSTQHTQKSIDALYYALCELAHELGF